MQRMSGVATQTAVYVKELEGLKTKVLDTRKTTPGMRVLDKIAVKLGGGENHRMGLFDMVILKGIIISTLPVVSSKAIPLTRISEGERARLFRSRWRSVRWTISATCSLRAVADRIHVGQFTPELTREAVKLIGGQAEIESSGNYA